MVRRANKKCRQHKKRRKVLVIATEGANKTEKIYFNEFNRMQDEFRVVNAPGNYTDPIKIVQSAMYAAKKEELDYDDGDMAIAVFDVDFNKQEQIISARKLADKHDVKVVLSNPCFEVWLLLHFRESTKSYSNNESVLEDLRKFWKGYEKNISSYKFIEKQTTSAIANAKKVKKHFSSNNCTDDVLMCNSSTDVYQIVELLHKAENAD